MLFPELEQWEVDFRKLQFDIEREREAALPPLPDGDAADLADPLDPAPLWVAKGGETFAPVRHVMTTKESAVQSVPMAGGSKASKKQAARVAAAAAASGKLSPSSNSEEQQEDGATNSTIKGKAAITASANLLGLTFKESVGAAGSVKAQDWSFSLVKDKKVEGHVARLRPGPRITEADIKSDEKSLERKLAERLFLVVKRDGKWDMPCAHREGSESMVAAARRAAQAILPNVAQDRQAFHFYSPLPAGYRRGLNDGLDFFYHAVLIDTTVRASGDYAWLTGEELVSRLCADNDDDAKTYMRVLTGVM